METDEQYLLRMRVCFMGGYTLPQYCIDKGIKNPLFVSEEKFLQFMWEVHVQFIYDKRMTVQFSVLDMPEGEAKFPSMLGSVRVMKYSNFSKIRKRKFDAIIMLTTKEVAITKKVISLSELTKNFINRVYVEIPTLNFLRRYPKVKLIMTGFPLMSRYGGVETFKKGLFSLEKLRDTLRKNKSGTIKTNFENLGYSNKDVLDLTRGTAVIVNLDGSTSMRDNKNHFINIKNNKRVTSFQPEHYQNKIYIVGTCHHYGIDAPYDKTIASYLQKMLNDANLPYRVENESQRYARRYQDIFYNLNKLDPAPGDIIFLYVHRHRIENIPFLDLADAFDPPHDYKEIFCVKGHVNELGYKILAERYFKYLTENNFFRDVCFNYPTPPQCITDMVYHHNSSRAA